MSDRLRVKWTVLHRQWVGDDYSGHHVDTAPPETCVGEVVGFTEGKAVVRSNETLELLALDELTVLS